jgi:ferredoxin
MERFYPIKGKRADQMFLGNEQVLASSAAAGYCRDLEHLAEKSGISLAIESNAADKDKFVIIASFYASSQNNSKYLDQLALVFEMDELGIKHNGRLYHVGIYNSPFIKHRFDASRLAGLWSIKQKLDPKGLFNPGKFFSISTAWTRFIPGKWQSWGAKVMIRILRTGWGRRLAKAVIPATARAKTEHADIFRVARECVNCGFCLPICPAYLATRDERTTARGKLFLALQWLEGNKLSPEDVERVHSCIHCAGCTQVCQSALDLVPTWYSLEQHIASEYGKPSQAIENFVCQVEASADYKRLLRQGFILNPVPLRK